MTDTKTAMMDNAKRREDREERRAADQKRLEASREATNELNAAVMEQSVNSKPTPTPAEIDAAIAGHHVADKEDDGSGPDPHDPEVLRRRAIEQATGSPYRTREAVAAQDQRVANAKLGTSTASKTDADKDKTSDKK